MFHAAEKTLARASRDQRQYVDIMPHADMHAELHHDGELLLIEVTMGLRLPSGGPRAVCILFWGSREVKAPMVRIVGS